jgi:hypothetical protein
MGAVNSVEYAKEITVPVTFLDPTEVGARLRVHKTSYNTGANGLGINSTIVGPTFPKGAKFVRGYLHSGALGTNATLKVTLTKYNANDANGNNVDVLAATSFAANALIQIPDAAGALLASMLQIQGNPIITLAGNNTAANMAIELVTEYILD